MPLSVGERLGPYQILAQIGAGGMGEVYRARDTKLDRDVAIKVLPAALAQHPDRLARFEREAKVLAALNHPNIAAIYGLEDRAIVMELVEGPTLADLIAGGAIPLEESLKIAAQIADALEAAHEKGVVHRDLKPANVKVREDGTVKVLDFGLATALQSGTRDAASGANSPTLTMGATEVGVILGTAAYMSPEQAAGKPVDRRADIWSFGVVLFEMLTGKRLFDGGETISHTLADVLRAPLDFDRLPSETPFAIRELLRRCLDRDVKTRLRDIGEARIALSRVGIGAESPAPADSLPQKRQWGWMTVAAVTTVVALAMGFLAYRHVTEETRVLRLFVPPPEQGSYDTGNSTAIPAVSPDGRRIVFLADVGGKSALWVRELDSLVSRMLAGTDDPRHPFWSPDSRAIGFFSGGKLKRIDMAGGPAQTLADAVSGRGGTWSRDDVIVFAPGNSTALFRVPAAGGTATPVTELDNSRTETAHRYPWFLPDGRHFLFSTRATDVEKAGVFVGDLSDPKARTSVLIAAATNTVYVPPGYLLFMREGTLMAQPFDAAKAKTTGDAVPIAENVDYGNFNFSGHFSASSNVSSGGVLAYTIGGSDGALQLTWFDRTGAPQGTLGKPGFFQWPAISPDGKTVAVDRGTELQAGGMDIWLYDLARGGADSRFTFGPVGNAYPVWSPDGSHIGFTSAREGPARSYQRATAGTGQDEALDKPAGQARLTDWSRDGRYIFETRLGDPKTHADVWVIPLVSDKPGDKKEPFKYLDSEFSENSAKLSPDGRWLAYTSDETKRSEVYVQSFPMKGRKWEISTGGGDRPVWSRDGKELYFISADQKMMAVTILGGAQFASVPKALFDVRIRNFQSFDVSKEGRFLIPVQGEQAATGPMTVVVNWQAGLKK